MDSFKWHWAHSQREEWIKTALILWSGLPQKSSMAYSSLSPVNLAPYNACGIPVCILSPFRRVWLCNPMDCSPPGSSVPGFPRREHWSGLPSPPPGDLPDQGPGTWQELRKALRSGLTATTSHWRTEMLQEAHQEAPWDYQFPVKIYVGRSCQSLNPTQRTSKKKFTIMIPT